jgi:PAS domain S-box-containing protein
MENPSQEPRNSVDPLESPLRSWIAVFGILALGLILGGYWYYRVELNRISQEKYENLSAIGALKSSQIQQWRRERSGDARVIIQDPLIVAAITEFLKDTSNQELRSKLKKSLFIRAQAYRYSEVILTRPDGQALLSTSLKDTAISPETKQALEFARTSAEIVLSDLFVKSQDQTYLDVVARIGDSLNPCQGLVILRCDVNVDLNPLAQSWPTPSRSAESMVVQRLENEVVYLTGLRFGNHSPLSMRMGISNREMLTVKAVQGAKGLFNGRDYRGVEVLADLRPIPESPWFMVSKVDKAEIFSEVQYRANGIGVLVGLFLLFAAAATAFIYRARQLKLLEFLYASERKRSESQQVFRTTLYSIGDAVITTDTGGLIKEMNPVAELLTGYSEGKAQGKPLDVVFRIVNGKTRMPLESPISAVLRGEGQAETENDTLLKTHDGRECPIHHNAAPIRNINGIVTGIVLVFSDQSKKYAIQQALQNMNRDLEQRVLDRTAEISLKNKELETFSYTVSHDLKAPLRGIDGYSKLLLEDYEDKLDEQGKVFLGNIRSGTAQMQQLIEDLLAYSKLERRNINIGVLNLKREIENIIVEKKYDLEKVNLSVDLQSDSVLADHDGLAMALRNLIDNALKFSKLRNPPTLSIQSHIDGPNHIISVSDNGTGFDMKHHDTIFQIFQRLHRIEEYGGTGVGLAIVKKAMDRMHGRVWAKSEINHGSVFYLELPRNLT